MHLDPRDPDAILFGFTAKEMITFGWVTVLSFWGGMVNYMNRITAHKVAFSLLGLLTELTTCSFVGWVTYLSAQRANFGPQETAVMVAIAAHMGTRALAKFSFYKVGKGNDPE